MKWERLAIIILVIITMTVFLVPIVHMPSVPNTMTVNAPAANADIFSELYYLTISGLLAGLNPLLILASLILVGLLFVYNKSRIPGYTKYYLAGIFIMFFTFEYNRTLPGGIEVGTSNFIIMMLMAVASILIALLAQEFSPGFARSASRNETVKITFFIFIGALVALDILLYGNSLLSPVVGYAAESGHSALSLLMYNLFVILPSFAIFTLISNIKYSLHTPLANNKESIMLLGTIMLFISMLVLEIYSLLIGQ
ncbi:MAG TPA: hypothetical protein VK436_10710 [Methanocella sp.]|nr:hypothetical protein [Methanocella sp.]